MSLCSSGYYPYYEVLRARRFHTWTRSRHSHDSQAHLLAAAATAGDNTAGAMANKDERTEALRGDERQTLGLIAEVSTSEEWAQLLAVPLERAVARGNQDLAQKLVRAGTKIGNALHKAIEGGHGGITKDLLENGASVETQDRHGSSPLHIAAFNG